MRIFNITMDDPIQTRGFIKYIIDHKKERIVGLAMAKGDRMTIGKNNSKLKYLISLLLIMGVSHFFKNATITLIDKVRKKLARKGIGKDPSILQYAKSLGIPVFDIKTANNKAFQEELRKLKPDVIINQSQSIIRKDLLEIPTIGVLSRHNALLPKNRGRLTPFWVLLKKEKYTGVSIHFVDEGIDAGDIIIQEKYPIEKRDTFNSLVRKNYKIAPKAMIAVLELGNTAFIPNNDDEATYNSVPTLSDAFNYRTSRLRSFFELN